MGVELFPVFDRDIPDKLPEVAGKALARNLDELDRMATDGGVTPISTWIRADPAEVADLLEGDAAELTDEDWFDPADALRTVRTILSKGELAHALRDDLQQLEATLVLAQKHGARFNICVSI